MEKAAKIVAVIIIAAGIILFVGIITAWPIQLLWNWLMPKIFGLPLISFWEAFGLMVLSGLLLKPSSTKSDK